MSHCCGSRRRACRSCSTARSLRRSTAPESPRSARRSCRPSRCGRRPHWPPAIPPAPTRWSAPPAAPAGRCGSRRTGPPARSRAVRLAATHSPSASSRSRTAARRPARTHSASAPPRPSSTPAGSAYCCGTRPRACRCSSRRPAGSWRRRRRRASAPCAHPIGVAKGNSDAGSCYGGSRTQRPARRSASTVD